MAPYAATATGIPLSQAFLANTIAIIVFLCLLPFAGMLSLADRFVDRGSGQP